MLFFIYKLYFKGDLFMKNKKMAVVVASSIILGSVLTISADTLITKVQAEVNKGISVTYNGQVAPLKDANGNAVYAMSYNGSTYLPVRAVAGIFGEDVAWDNATQTVILGKVEKQPVRLRDIITAGSRGGIVMDSSKLSIVTADGTSNYDHGVYFDIWNSSYSTGKGRQASFDISQYDTLTFTAYSDVDATIGIFDENGKPLSTQDIKANTLTPISWDVSGFDGVVGLGADAPNIKDNGTFMALDAMIK